MEVTSLIDTYCQAWSASEEAERSRLLQQVWSPKATYTDPTAHAEGTAELLAHIAAVIARRPGSRVLRTSPVDQHHGVARFAWRAIEADGTELPEGIDIAFISTDGTKIERVLGFFGPTNQLVGIESARSNAQVLSEQQKPMPTSASDA